jgi:hypothetical protein
MTLIDGMRDHRTKKNDEEQRDKVSSEEDREELV